MNANEIVLEAAKQNIESTTPTATAAVSADLPATAAAARAVGIKIQSTRRPASEGAWVRGEIVAFAGGKRFAVVECEFLPRDEDNQRFRAEFRALMIEVR